MPTLITQTTLSRFSRFAAAHLGLALPANRRADLERGLVAVTRAFGFKDDVEACLRWLDASPPDQQRIAVLAAYLTVGETYFFRETHAFAVLEQAVLPALIAARQGAERRLRIWSVGCSTGEEPYSIAILLVRTLPQWRDWNITLLATDINAQALRKASAGVYREWSFRDAPEWLKKEYMLDAGEGRLQVVPEIRAMVDFAFHNLARDPYPAVTNNTNAMDVIFCCNVLMYFTPDIRARVVDRFFESLAEGGVLIVSPAEAIPSIFPAFEAVSLAGGLVFRRPGEQPQPTVSPPRLEVPALPVTLPQPIATPRIPSPSPPPPASLAPAGGAYEAALALYQQGRYRQAVGKLREMEEPDAKAMALLARLYANQGKLAEAWDVCEKAVATDKMNPGHHYLCAEILQELGRDDAAAQALDRALYLDPGLVVAHVSLGTLLRRMGRREEAQRHLRTALLLLRERPRDESVPHSEGMTVGRLRQAILAIAPQGQG